MNSDLISRSALTERIVDLLVFEWGYEGIEASVKRIFSEIPAVDAVEVVRCGLCKHWDVDGLYCHHPAGLSYCGKRGAKNGFCCFGERRGDE